MQTNLSNPTDKPVTFTTFGVLINVPAHGSINVHTYPGYGTGITVRQPGRKGQPVISRRVDRAQGEAAYAVMLADASKVLKPVSGTGTGRSDVAAPDFA